MNLLNLFANETEFTDLAPGEAVFREYDPGDAMYVVIAGCIHLSVRGHRFRQLAAGELFGEMALIDARPRSATATAESVSTVAQVDERRFTFLVQQTPYFALHVMRVLAGRLRQMDATLS